MTCLFVGNLTKQVTIHALSEVFRSYGKCKVELKGPYAFVEYEEPDCTRQAMKELNKTNLKLTLFHGSSTNVFARLPIKQ